MFSGTSIFFFFFFILFLTARCVRCKLFDTHCSFDGQPKSVVQRFRVRDLGLATTNLEYKEVFFLSTDAGFVQMTRSSQ
jgi:hypothetical protein